MEKIEVGYSQAAVVGELGSGVYHKYILYTNSDGEQFYARGGPGYFGPGATLEKSSSPFGNLKAEYGRYRPDTPDWDEARDPQNNQELNPHPREIIKEADDLSLEWDKIKETIDRIEKQKIPYDPRTSNSNATVDEALRALRI